ncbi:UNVERIFIED_CONTAM: hypothetical protein Scaly_2423800 [Sesamum calycinum]|uniref:Tf2-1-like SH3-like domain-containing protein n=1 Tax=Sesamum calycinum TaxID=2727403 RepID=A0AAW2M2H4_9LAMI
MGIHLTNSLFGPYMQNHHSEVEELMQERAKVVQLLKENLQQAQQRMKLYADKKRTEREFLVGKVAYKLALPPGSKIHPVFHVSLLKKKIGTRYFPSVSLPDFEDEVFKVYPSAILARRLVPRNNVGVPQVLIQWSHGSPDQATWEDYKDMATKFPGFDPWGQGSKIGGRDVASTSRNAILKGECEIEGGNLGRQIKGRIELSEQLGDFERNAAVSKKSVKEVAITNQNATSARISTIRKMVSPFDQGHRRIGG